MNPPEPNELTLFVVNLRHGPDKYQPPLPQSMIPVGYWPVRGRPCPARSSNVTVCDESSANVATYVVSADGVKMSWVAAPPSDHALNVYALAP